MEDNTAAQPPPTGIPRKKIQLTSGRSTPNDRARLADISTYSTIFLKEEEHTMTRHNQNVQSTANIGRLAVDPQINTGGRRDKNVLPSRETAVALQRKKKPVAEMILFGTMSVIAYVFIFSNETLITKTFTLGGWHAAFPVLTAFFFSFVHGAFASKLLSVLGLEAKKS
jgi:uncharacterized integral membrane protein